MDIDIELWVRSLVAGASAVPAALIAITLLGGPTLIWLLYRWVVKPKSSRYHLSQIDALWICAGCRSANELRSSNCYRCHRELDESELELMAPGLRESIPIREPTEVARPARRRRRIGPSPAISASGRHPVAVGPGKPGVERPAAALVERTSPSKGDRPAKPGADRSAKRKVERPAQETVDQPAKPKVERPRRAAAGHAATKRSEVRFVHQPASVAQDEVPAAHEAAR